MRHVGTVQSKTVNMRRSDPRVDLEKFKADCERWCASSHEHPKKQAHHARADEYDAVLDMSAEKQREWRKRKAAAGWDDIILENGDNDAEDGPVADADSWGGHVTWKELPQALWKSMMSSFAGPRHNGRRRGAWSPPPRPLGGRFAF